MSSREVEQFLCCNKLVPVRNETVQKIIVGCDSALLVYFFVHAYQVFATLGIFSIILNLLTSFAVISQIATILFYLIAKCCCNRNERRIHKAVEYHLSTRGLLIAFYLLEMIVIYPIRCFGKDDDAPSTGCD